jgi:hypothetical protein
VPPKTIKFDTDKHEYVVDGEKVPGVTTIIGKTMPKDALTWWGMRVGIASVIRLLREHDLSWPVLQSIDPDHVIDPLKIPPGEGHFTKSDRKRQKPRTLVEVMVVDNKLSTNHIRDQRGDEGSMTHDAIHKMGVEMELPNLSDYPEEQRPYLRALAKWWSDQEVEFLEQEILVASVDGPLAYGGTPDLIALRDGKRGLYDFKTSKAVRESHHPQLVGYEKAYVECGGDPLEEKWVVNLRGDGTYEMEPCLATMELWDAMCAYYKQLVPFLDEFNAKR